MWRISLSGFEVDDVCCWFDVSDQPPDFGCGEVNAVGFCDPFAELFHGFACGSHFLQLGDDGLWVWGERLDELVGDFSDLRFFDPDTGLPVFFASSVWGPRHFVEHCPRGEFLAASWAV